MLEWNVVVTAREQRYRQAHRFLQPLGEVAGSDFYNVLLLRVDAPQQFLEQLSLELAAEPGGAAALARVVPVSETFVFQSPSQFEQLAGERALRWLPKLAGSRFYVRMHRRGFKGRLSSQQEERFLDHRLLEALATQGHGGQIDFSNPDWVLALETVGQRAGMSLWSREQRQRYPLLRLD
jgi:tRNA(Ser,Leu) C12 N-acetylase TAN1